MTEAPAQPQLRLLRELCRRHRVEAPPRKVFATGLTALDALLPEGGFPRGAVHEVLCDPAHGQPRFFALLLARAAYQTIGGDVAWSNPRRDLYPPALAAIGLPLDRLLLLHPRAPADEVWAIAECLACRGVAATVAAPPPLSRVQARRLQLAAERGGGAGVLLRSTGPTSAHYAAATRWLVAPAPGTAAVQRWTVQLLHGHGGFVGKTLTLEVSRDPVLLHADPVRAIETLADRPPTQAPAAVRASA